MKLSELTALYSPLDIEYNQAMSGPYSDLSTRDDDCEVVAGLKDGRISGFWRPMVAVGNEDALKKQIEKLWLISQDIYYMDLLIGGELSVVSRFLLEKGYQARPVYTQVIDLTKSETQLHADLRKSYSSLINKDIGICYVSRFHSDFKVYHALHSRISHRESRCQASWDIQWKMIENNQSFLVVRQRFGGAILIYHNGNCAYYASGKKDPDIQLHALLYRAIIEAKEQQGCMIFELGEQVFYVGQKMMDGKLATEKNVNISLFKKGFGGKTVTRLILEKP